MTLDSELKPSFSIDQPRKPELTLEQINILKEMCILMEKLHGRPYNFYDNPALYKQEAFSEVFCLYQFQSLFFSFAKVFNDLERAWYNFHYGIGGPANKETVEVCFKEWREEMSKLDEKYKKLREEYLKLQP